MKQFKIASAITQRDYGSLDRYFHEINRFDLSSPGEEVLLAQRIQQGDEVALQRLVNTNLRFVVSVAKQYQNSGMTMGDLINEGNLGLITAARRFDATKGFKFISFAVWWIRQSIIFAVAEQTRIVHLPYNLVTLLSKYHKAVSKLEQQLNRRPTDEELSECLEVAPEKIRYMLYHAQGGISIDDSVSNHSDHTLLEILPHQDLPADHIVAGNAVKEVVREALGTLGKREQDIIQLYFGLGHFYPLQLEDIARKFNLSVEHTRRLKDNALKRLSESSHGPLLRSCLIN